MLGRGTRIADGKENCLVLDFARNTPRLGPINDHCYAVPFDVQVWVDPVKLVMVRIFGEVKAATFSVMSVMSCMVSPLTVPALFMAVPMLV